MRNQGETRAKPGRNQNKTFDFFIWFDHTVTK